METEYPNEIPARNARAYAIRFHQDHFHQDNFFAKIIVSAFLRHSRAFSARRATFAPLAALRVTLAAFSLGAGVIGAIGTISTIGVIVTPGTAYAASAAQTDTPVGTWQTVDDHTGQPKALVQIEENGNGTLGGKIVRGLGANNQPDRRCTACTDARKNQLMAGMTIISGMKKSADGWDGGQILDPENGKTYRCKMTLEDGGRKLVVRGYVGISLLGRSQVWNRQP